MTTAEGSPTMSTQVCTFILGDYLFGIEVKNIQEVIRYQQMTPVPLAPSTIRGLINLRGQIVSAIDMRARLGLPARENAEPINVVVCTDDGVVSLLVDDVGDVVDVDDDTFERAPETMSGAFRELVTGIYKLDRLLLLLDVERVAYDAPTARLKEIS